MDAHSMIFVIIDKLVSPSSSVNGDPLDDFPDHWQPRFSAQFLLRPPPPNKSSIRSRLLKPGYVVSLASLARQDVYTEAGLN